MIIDLDAYCDCRACECIPRGSWFREWMRIWPVSEAPHSYILMSVMGILSGVLGRKVYMYYENWRKTYAMLNILLIGPSGIGKSTSVSMAQGLLPFVPTEKRPQFLSGSCTKEKLHEDLVLQPHTIVFSPELATLFSKEQYKEGLIPYVTNLLDYLDRIESSTRKDGLTYVDNPEVTILGASTREWLTNMLPDTASQGGFLPRFLPVLEEQRGQRIANPKRQLSEAQQQAIRERHEKVCNAFTSIALCEGELDYEDAEAASVYSRWYNSNTTPTGGLAPFYARAQEMVLRIAMLFAVSCKRMELTEEDIKGAIALYTYLQKRFADITVATTTAGKLLHSVRDEITFSGTPIIKLYHNLTSLAPVPELQKQLHSLVASEHIRIEDNIAYKLK